MVSESAFNRICMEYDVLNCNCLLPCNAFMEDVSIVSHLWRMVEDSVWKTGWIN